MNSRYVLKYILINKDANFLNAVEFLNDNYSDLILSWFEEDDKYFKLKQTDLSEKYFPILLEEINSDLGIKFLYYSSDIFPTPAKRLTY